MLKKLLNVIAYVLRSIFLLGLGAIALVLVGVLRVKEVFSGKTPKAGTPKDTGAAPAARGASAP